MNIACLNCNGLRDENKFQSLKRLLKETHWSNDRTENIKKRWQGDIFVNHRNAKARGVATLIKEGRVNSAKEVYKDGNRRVLVTELVFKINFLKYLYAKHRK